MHYQARGPIHQNLLVANVVASLTMEGSHEELIPAWKSDIHGDLDFLHPPLDYKQDHDAIRLLRVSPSSIMVISKSTNDKVLRGRRALGAAPEKQLPRRVFDSGDPREIHCLSYTWGAPSPKHNTLLNGYFFPVRTNIFDFLNVARRLHASKNLWIDALCIDQTNAAERSHQVQRMDRIYRAAEEVLVWLGSSTALEHIAACVIRRENKWRLPYSARKHFLEIAPHPYWSRAWVSRHAFEEMAMTTHYYPSMCFADIRVVSYPTVLKRDIRSKAYDECSSG